MPPPASRLLRRFQPPTDLVNGMITDACTLITQDEISKIMTGAPELKSSVSDVGGVTVYGCDFNTSNGDPTFGLALTFNPSVVALKTKEWTALKMSPEFVQGSANGATTYLRGGPDESGRRGTFVAAIIKGNTVVDIGGQGWAIRMILMP